jgi:hypothetical protein
MSEPVNNLDLLAQKYIRLLVNHGMKSVPVYHQDSHIRVGKVYGESATDFVKRIDKEFKKDRWDRYDKDARPERFDIGDGDVVDKFVLQCGKKYFYGLHSSEIKWTYEPKLALKVTDLEARALGFWLEEFGTPVTRYPAPKGEQ